jgi:hypothetical protein
MISREIKVQRLGHVDQAVTEGCGCIKIIVRQALPPWTIVKPGKICVCDENLPYVDRTQSEPPHQVRPSIRSADLVSGKR